MVGGREILNRGSAKFVRRHVDLAGAGEGELLEWGEKALKWKKRALIKLGQMVQADERLGAFLDNEFVGEDNAGVDALGIITGEIESCDHVLTECKRKNYDPLRAYAQREMEWYDGLFERKSADEEHAAGLENPNWRIFKELGISRREVMQQWAFWFRVVGF